LPPTGRRSGAVDVPIVRLTGTGVVVVTTREPSSVPPPPDRVEGEQTGVKR
jgi:hypothetical protein